MAPGFPLRVEGIPVRTSEALYQACRFPHLPDVQEQIIAQTSPMTAKMKSKPHRKYSRPDWMRVRVAIMKWCLRVKLVQNWESFGALLEATDKKAIVEDSRKDSFWGAKPVGEDRLVGENTLGRLLMEVRDILRSQPESLHQILPVPIENFSLMGRPITAIYYDGSVQPDTDKPHNGLEKQQFEMIYWQE